MPEGEPGWEPTWAEVVQESYFVTSCANLPCGAGAFADIAVSVAELGRPFNETTPRLLATVPWSEAYEIEGQSGDPGAPVCDGHAAAGDGGSADVTFNCGAPHGL